MISCFLPGTVYSVLVHALHILTRLSDRNLPQPKCGHMTKYHNSELNMNMGRPCDVRYEITKYD